MEYGPPGDQPPYSAQPPMEQPPAEQYPYSRPSGDDLIRRSYPKGKSGIYKFISTDKIVTFVVIGVFLIFLGSLFIAAIAIPGPPNEFDEKYDDDDDGDIDGDKRDNYTEDIRTYELLRDVLVTLGVIIILLGMMALAMPLIGGGIGNTEIDRNVRIGMLITAGLVIFAQVALLQAVLSSSSIYSLLY